MSSHDPKDDARGQFAPSQADRKNTGLSSATPRDVTHHDDATLDKAAKKPSPDPGFDERKPARNQ